MRPIDADAFVIPIALYMAENAYLNDTALDVLKKISKWLEKEPTLDYEPVRHGEWIDFDDGFDDITFECSLCKVVWWSDAGNKAYRYCPNCGAKMDGGKNDA